MAKRAGFDSRLLTTGETTFENGRLGSEVRYQVSDDHWRSIARPLNLSPRELEIAQHLFDAKSEAMIAWEMGLSIHTVHSHFARLYRKLGVHDRCELLLRIFAALVLHPPGGSGHSEPVGSESNGDHGLVSPVQATPEHVSPR